MQDTQKQGTWVAQEYWKVKINIILRAVVPEIIPAENRNKQL